MLDKVVWCAQAGVYGSMVMVWWGVFGEILSVTTSGFDIVCLFEGVLGSCSGGVVLK